MNRLPRQSSLFFVSEKGKDLPSLRGRRCEGCGTVLFPPQDYGCDRCGGAPDQLRPVELKGKGMLKSFATVHQHPSPSVKTPFVIGTVQLDEGPVIEAMVACKEDRELSVGKNVHAVLIEGERDKEGNIMVDYCFTPAPEAE
ncbi:Zn-ribbon domain-containing OB-fold protein [Thermodesulfobacteriota bacterium]